MMKKVFLDTNILIDYLARRGQFFEPAAQIVQLGQQHEFGLLVSAMSFATASPLIPLPLTRPLSPVSPTSRMPCNIIQPSARVPMSSSLATAAISTLLKSKSMSRNSSLICLRKNKQEGNALPRPQA